MKRAFSAAFSDVENIIDEAEVNEMYTNKNEKLKFKDVFMTLFFYFVLISPLYFFYFISKFIIREFKINPEEFAVPLDLNNAYISFLDNFHYVHLVAILYLIATIWFLVARKKSILKASLIYNTSLYIYVLALFIYLFKISQLFVNDPILRHIYTALLVVIIIYTIKRCYQKASLFIFDREIQVQSQKTKWNINNKKIIGGGVALLGFYQVFKLTALGKDYLDFERQLIGVIIEFFPLIVAFTPLTLLLFVKPLVRFFYLNKYSEQFRSKFGYEKKEWYGQL